jgi:hypothetical protein
MYRFIWKSFGEIDWIEYKWFLIDIFECVLENLKKFSNIFYLIFLKDLFQMI